MRHWKILLLLASILCVSALAFSHTDAVTDRQAFRMGYDEGYGHGSADYGAGLDADYSSVEYRSGISGDSYINSWFRDGYKQGYADGYSQRSSQFAGNGTIIYERAFVSTPPAPRYTGFASVYTDNGFSGSMREVGPGRYPDLEGRWNDSIDSVQIVGKVRLILFDQRNFQGQQLILEQDMTRLSELNFGDRAASMIVELR